MPTKQPQKPSLHRAVQWLLYGRQDFGFHCMHSANGCDVFHLTAPFMHSIGAFRSYCSYGSVIRLQLSKLLLKRQSVSLLICGIDSADSASALFSEISTHLKWVSVTFCDVCSTPLRKIRSSQCFIDYKINLVVSDIRNLPAQEFDIVIADSFLQQYESLDRHKFVGAMFRQMADGGILITREYIGDRQKLINLLWDRFGIDNYSLVNWKYSKCESYQFSETLNALKMDLYKNANLYQSPNELVEDLQRAGLGVAEVQSHNAYPDVVVIAQKEVKKGRFQECKTQTI